MNDILRRGTPSFSEVTRTRKSYSLPRLPDTSTVYPKTECRSRGATECIRIYKVRVGNKQVLGRHELDSGEFYRRLFKTRGLEPRLTGKGGRSKGVKPRDVEEPEAGTMSQVDTTADAKDGAGENSRTSSSRLERSGDDGSENEGPRPLNLTRAAKMVIGIMIGVVTRDRDFEGGNW